MKKIFLYLIFGVLTTLLNIFLYWFCAKIFEIPVVPATIIAWIGSILFAYHTNGEYVFESKPETFGAKLYEALNFFMCRLATGFVDVIIMYVFADLIGFDDVWVKTISNIVVIILNYLGSKILGLNNDE